MLPGRLRAPRSDANTGGIGHARGENADGADDSGDTDGHAGHAGERVGTNMVGIASADSGASAATMHDEVVADAAAGTSTRLGRRAVKGIGFASPGSAPLMDADTLRDDSGGGGGGGFPLAGDTVCGAGAVVTLARLADDVGVVRRRFSADGARASSTASTQC